MAVDDKHRVVAEGAEDFLMRENAGEEGIPEDEEEADGRDETQHRDGEGHNASEQLHLGSLEHICLSGWPGTGSASFRGGWPLLQPPGKVIDTFSSARLLSDSDAILTGQNGI